MKGYNQTVKELKFEVQNLSEMELNETYLRWKRKEHLKPYIHIFEEEIEKRKKPRECI